MQIADTRWCAKHLLSEWENSYISSCTCRIATWRADTRSQSQLGRKRRRKKDEFICTKQRNRRRPNQRTEKISAEREMKIKFGNPSPTTYSFGECVSAMSQPYPPCPCSTVCTTPICQIVAHFCDTVNLVWLRRWCRRCCCCRLWPLD